MLYIPLDLIHKKDIRRYKQRYEAILDYYYECFTYFQNDRAKRLKNIKEAFLEVSEPYEFNSWHRLFDLKFVTNPLSARGSILNDPGGRFNMGDIDELKFAKFPALYIAQTYEIAYRERNQIPPDNKISGLSADELSFTKQDSTVSLLLNGKIKSVVDLTTKDSLKPFYDEIKDIKLPRSLEKRSNRLNIPPMYPVNSHIELRKSILMDNWRELPMVVDIPSNSQIFGQLAHAAGIEAILYPSKMSKEGTCLAIFTMNFSNSDSYVRIKDKELPQEIRYPELNSETWQFLF